MSKTQRVVELVNEIAGLEAMRDVKLSELQAIIGDGPKKKAGKKSNGSVPDSELSWPDAIVKYLSANRDKACKADEICESVGCPVHVLVYHMRALIDEKRVKRVKRGYYQLRGRG